MLPDKEVPMFGLVDMFILCVCVSVAVYYYFYHLAAKEDKSYSIQPSQLYSSSQPKEIASFISKLKSSGRSLLVFYGSQTGTAEEFAMRLAVEGVRYGLKGMVADPEEYDMSELPDLKYIPNSLVVFCLATYGEGDPTDNAMDFYEWIQNEVVDLEGVNYAVFGLGNKTYEHYNAVAIAVDKKLEENGATRVHEIGLGDDDANIEDDFITWKEKFWPSVCEYFNLSALGDEALCSRQYQLEIIENPDLEKIFNGEISRLHSYKNQRGSFDAKNPYMSCIMVNRELYKGERSCMHIELSLGENTGLQYNTGDHVGIYPENNASLVNRLGVLLGINLDTIFSLTNVDSDSTKQHPFPNPCSFRTAFTFYVDITSIPRSHIIKALVDYATDSDEKETLKLMCSMTPEGKILYHDWVVNSCRSIIHILEDFPSVKPAADHLCEILPRLQPRYYSISSSSKVYPNKVHITAAKVCYTTPTDREVIGVTTGWLSGKIPNANEAIDHVIPIYIRQSQFKLPSKVEVPCIMIGPGTGIAPFRGFIQEREFLKKNGFQVGETILYFGCRKRNEDFLYEDELNEFVEKGLLKLYVAFSRDQPEKRYVTHLMAENADELWHQIYHQSGHIYVCGDAKNMAKDVHDFIVKLACEKGTMSQDEAMSYVKSMESMRRYSADVWS